MFLHPWQGVAYCCAVCTYVYVLCAYVYVYVCVLYLCVYVALCPFMFVFDGVFGFFLVIFLVFRRMRPNFIDFSEVPFS